MKENAIIINGIKHTLTEDRKLTPKEVCEHCSIVKECDTFRFSICPAEFFDIDDSTYYHFVREKLPLEQDPDTPEYIKKAIQELSNRDLQESRIPKPNLDIMPDGYIRY